MKMFLLIFFALAVFAPITVRAQQKSIIGKVIDYSSTNRGWGYITVQSRTKEYSILVEPGAFAPVEKPRRTPSPKTVGNVTEVGRYVQVFYSRQTPGGDVGDLWATKVVEIKKSSGRE